MWKKRIVIFFLMVMMVITNIVPLQVKADADGYLTLEQALNYLNFTWDSSLDDFITGSYAESHPYYVIYRPKVTIGSTSYNCFYIIRFVVAPTSVSGLSMYDDFRFFDASGNEMSVEYVMSGNYKYTSNVFTNVELSDATIRIGSSFPQTHLSTYQYVMYHNFVIEHSHSSYQALYDYAALVLTPTPSPTPTSTPTPTPTNTPTPGPTNTPTPTNRPIATPRLTATPRPTATIRPTATPRPYVTATNTPTPKPTNTVRPTSTPRPTTTPRPTGLVTETTENLVENTSSIFTLIERILLLFKEFPLNVILAGWFLVIGISIYVFLRNGIK